MSDPRLRLLSPSPAAPRAAHARRLPLGRLLFEMGALDADDLVSAQMRQRNMGVPLGTLLLAEGRITEDQLLDAVADQTDAQRLNPLATPPDWTVMRTLPLEFCLRHQVCGWMRFGGLTVIATDRPERFAEVLAELPERHKPAMPAVLGRDDIRRYMIAGYGRDMVDRAETLCPGPLSCRTWQGTRAYRALAGLALLGTIGWGAATAPLILWQVLCAIAVGMLILAMGLKLSAFVARLTAPPRPLRKPPGAFTERGRKRPRVSLLVPMYREPEMAGALIARLSRLTYPKPLLEVHLLVEEHDLATQEAIAQEPLPPWLHVICLPKGRIATKPRALNAALPFCRGEIVGIYDTEDAPDPDQIDRVVAHFAAAPPEVVCLQGALDYYNAASSWIARCFTIEYATWFRMILPGVARMGLPIPLGGTTVFLRRAPLEEMGGWDAHNVTEDADLGLRLARYGYRTELLDSTTREEATMHAWPWVRQRSRWIKGYMITWAVHMRDPFALWQDLGTWRFLGVQAFFLTAISQPLLAPILWSFWPLILGYTHPLVPVIGTGGIVTLVTLFFASEILNLTIAMTAVSGPGHRRLIKWTPLTILYFPLASIAALKALYELISRPFFWDKTTHGHSLRGRGLRFWRRSAEVV